MLTLRASEARGGWRLALVLCKTVLSGLPLPGRCALMNRFTMYQTRSETCPGITKYVDPDEIFNPCYLGYSKSAGLPRSWVTPAAGHAHARACRRGPCAVLGPPTTAPG